MSTSRRVGSKDPTLTTVHPGASHSPCTTGVVLSVQAAIREAPLTASSALPTASAEKPSSASVSAARARFRGVGLHSRTDFRSRTRAIARTWARAWVPEPSTARSVLSGVASASTATALAAAVRRVVTAAPSMTATRRPVTGSSTETTAWIVGSPAAALPGLTLPNFATAPESAESRETYAKTTLSSKRLGCMIFAGRSAAPEPSAVKAARCEAMAVSASSRRVTCDPERKRTSSVIPSSCPDFPSRNPSGDQDRWATASRWGRTWSSRSRLVRR